MSTEKKDTANSRQGLLRKLLIGIIAVILWVYLGYDYITPYFKDYDITKVHFIDVGQGDSILIESDGHFLLIDAGERDKGNIVIDYLTNQGVTQLDYIIGTHPHSDHIGGLSDVIQAIDSDVIMLPGISHTTKTYEKLLTAIEQTNHNITVPSVGEIYSLGDTSFTILGPVSTYNDINNNSISIRLAHGENSFILTGDSEIESETDMAEGKNSLKSTVLKAGHHGSHTASSNLFLDAVSPKYVIISCGKDNDYGHPHKEAVKRIEEHSATIYRTDEHGNIVITSDGTSLNFDFQIE